MRIRTRLRWQRAAIAVPCVAVLGTSAFLTGAAAAESTSAQQRLAAVRAQAADVAARIDDAEGERAAIEDEISELDTKIRVSAARVEELRSKVRRRAAWLYRRVATPTLDVAVDTSNVVDAQRAVHLAFAAGDHDQSAMADLQNETRVLEDRRAQRSARQSELDELIAALVPLRDQLDDEIARAVRASRQVTRADTAAGGGATFAGSDDAVWLAFRECTFAHESGGNYQIVSRDGLYYGAWQFAIGTWNAVASRMGRGDLVGVLPSDASPADQDAVAHALWLESGNRPWGGRC